MLTEMYRYAVQWRRGGIQCTMSTEDMSQGKMKRLTCSNTGRTVHRVNIAVRMGGHGHRPLHRALGCRSSMVSIPGGQVLRIR